MDNQPILNNVSNRFLPLSESVSKGLEPEGKIEDFNVIKKIGEGTFGTVYLAKYKKTGSIYAIKEINKLDKNNQEGKPYFRREIEIMYKVHHPNVVKLYSHFEDNKNCYIIMEYINKGNVYSHPNWIKNKRLSTQEVAKYIKDIISAVYYLHNMNPPIIHRDIKPENVLIDEKGVAKLTDFGWSNYVNSEVRSTFCGTPLYLAPEMLTEFGHDEHLDIWSIGVLMFELLTGNVPFYGNDFQSLNKNILNLRIRWPVDINLKAKDLIKRILKPNPEERISLSDMIRHPFFVSNLPKNELDNCLKKPINLEYKPFILAKNKPEDVKDYFDTLKNDSTNKNDSSNSETTNFENLNEIGADDINYKQLYYELNEKFENSISLYNQSINEKKEIKKLLEEANLQNQFLTKEKNIISQELELSYQNNINLRYQLEELGNRNDVSLNDDNVDNLEQKIVQILNKNNNSENENQKIIDELKSLLSYEIQKTNENYKQNEIELNNTISNQKKIIENFQKENFDATNLLEKNKNLETKIKLKTKEIEILKLKNKKLEMDLISLKK